MRTRILVLALFLALAGHFARGQTTQTLSAANQCTAPIDVTGLATVGMQMTGTWSATLQPEVAIGGQPAVNTTVAPSTASSSQQATITANGGYIAGVAGYSSFLVCVSAYVSGTVTIHFLGSVRVNAGLFGGGAGALPGDTYYMLPTCGSTANCLQLVDDNSTDNCTTALTTFMTTLNAYAGPGVAQLWITGGSGSGSAYKFTSCNVKFTNSINIHLNATINCAQASGDCWEFGASGLSGYGAGPFPVNGCTSCFFALEGTGTFIGGASLTTGGIVTNAYTAYFSLTGAIQMYNFGPGNATSGNCTAYAINLLTLNNGTIQGLRWVSADATKGRCAISNTDQSTGGNASVIINDVWLSGNWIAGDCASQGIVTGGSHVTIENSSIAGFGIPIRVQADVSTDFGTIINGNLLDPNGCPAAKGVSADIHLGGNGSSNMVQNVVITANDVHGGSVTNFVSLAGDTLSTTAASLVIGDNESEFGTTTVTNVPCNQGVVSTPEIAETTCSQHDNKNMLPGGTVGAPWTEIILSANCVTISTFAVNNCLDLWEQATGASQKSKYLTFHATNASSVDVPVNLFMNFNANAGVNLLTTNQSYEITQTAIFSNNTALTTSHITLSAGWGTGCSGASSTCVSAISGYAQRFRFTITTGTSPTANPTFTVVPSDLWAFAPLCKAQMTGGTGVNAAIYSGTETAGSTGTMTLQATPSTSALTYIITVDCRL